MFSLAQTNVLIKINHKLGSQSFSYNQNATNNQGDAFQVTRLEYYISEIKLTYDGGVDTIIKDLWILVDANNSTNVTLGTYVFQNLESVSFGIGVQSTINHLDPSSYPSSHPLAPKSPSMHWGWSAGYRFVAMEGTAASRTDIFQIHALDDMNYHVQTIQTSGEVLQSGDLLIELNADYERALENISVNGGLTNHGSFGEAALLLTNFRDHVFTDAKTNVGLNEFSNSNVSIYPNPALVGQSIEIIDDSKTIENVSIFDLSGRIILKGSALSIKKATTSLNSGTYIVAIEFNDKSSAKEKLIITN